jgi:hypothetical protein
VPPSVQEAFLSILRMGNLNLDLKKTYFINMWPLWLLLKP